MFDKVKAMVGLNEQEEKGLIGQIDEAVTLTWKQRLIGFGCCFGFGVLLTLISIPMLWTVQITKFAILYSVGSVISVLSTLFLMGPVKQFQRMFEEKRFLATIAYFAAIGATLAVAFTTGNAGLCLVMLVLQILALVWYCLTWVPGGQAALKSMIFRGG
ncbi:Vesicle transport protein SFT2B [Tetrabaena socialis]|uniref:Vesicle transport protein n=1 Tax=Tetrabaena socialis TaxID=47790 RepID=A0A2J8AEK2_9CHLO|nr:Vesicle transport protein SFT2B [Tetrabaena socialis]|eukprot:PNH10950.1 Vesicle transport protein SFT2B [Tetrabaena socialis]